MVFWSTRISATSFDLCGSVYLRLGASRGGYLGPIYYWNHVTDCDCNWQAPKHIHCGIPDHFVLCTSPSVELDFYAGPPSFHLPVAFCVFSRNSVLTPSGFFGSVFCFNHLFKFNTGLYGTWRVYLHTVSFEIPSTRWNQLVLPCRPYSCKLATYKL